MTRLHEGRWNKVRRGALKRSLPVGYVARADGTVQKDPGRQVQARITYVFRLLMRLRGARKVLVQLRTEDRKKSANHWASTASGWASWMRSHHGWPP
jgi:hypothetical protein